MPIGNGLQDIEWLYDPKRSTLWPPICFSPISRKQLEMLFSNNLNY